MAAAANLLLNVIIIYFMYICKFYNLKCLV
jgi:hypothetical protein